MINLVVRARKSFSLSGFLFFATLVSFPFGTRILVHQFIRGFHEYETAFFYASDIFVLLFIFITFRLWFPRKYTLLYFLLDLITLAAIISVFLAYSKGLAVYSLLRFIMGMFLALGIAGFIRSRSQSGVRLFFGLFALGGVFQSIIAITQFVLQKSVGLHLLGESVLGSGIPGVARIPIEGLHFLRAYGTFPHPNILAAFLLLALFSLYYIYLRFDWQRCGYVYDRNKSVHDNFVAYRTAPHFIPRLFATLGIGLILVGLLFTFSRTGWGIALVLSVAMLARLLFKKEYRGAALRLALTLAAISVLLFTTFHWALFPRAIISFSEPAVTERISYNAVGAHIIEHNPWGVGIGNQVLHSVKHDIYDAFNIGKLSLWQPVHNIYLLIASEIGVLGLLGFLFFLAVLFRKMAPIISEMKLIALSMLATLLLFGLFDHFLWTLQPGRLMLWVIIGFVLSLAISQKPDSDKLN